MYTQVPPKGCPLNFNNFNFLPTLFLSRKEIGQAVKI